MWQIRPRDKEKEKRFLALGQNRLISRLLAQRNIQPNEINGFLNGDINDLSPINKLKGTERAAEIFLKVALDKGVVGVSSDYDADGVISATMLKELCNAFGLTCKVFLPSRVEHGYGLNHKSIASIKKKFVTPPSLMFIADCGSNSEEEVKELKRWGVKYIIIIDHHIIDPPKIAKSADVLINWHLQDDFMETCACGEVYHFIRSIRWKTKRVNAAEFLTYSAIGILADVSPVIGDNRIIVKCGLSDEARNHIVAAGCTALLENAYIKSLTQEDVLFKVAPRINAVGRMHVPDIAFNLLIESDLAMAELMAVNLTKFNDDRKEKQKLMEKEAISIVSLNLKEYEYGIVLYNPEWSVGIVGIVASKVVEAFHKPALIISRNGETIKGSGRSLEHINLKEILDLCKEMFVNYGGHSLSAGVTLKDEYIDSANRLFNDACKKYYEQHGYPSNITYYDAELSLSSVSLENVSMLLNTLYPYCGQNNPEPVFVLKGVTITDVESSDDKKNKSAWKSLNFIAEKEGQKTSLRFRMYSDEFGKEIDGKKADLYFSLPQTTSKAFGKDPQCNVIELILKK